MILASSTTSSTLAGVNVGVAELQRQLKRLAQRYANSRLDPGRSDGTMTLGTVIALANAVSVIGKEVHPVLGKVLSFVDLVRAPFSRIPYGTQIIDLILSPWIVDDIFDAVLAIVRLVPGGGSTADAIQAGKRAVLEAVTTAAPALAAGIALAVQKAPSVSGLGASSDTPELEFYDPATHGRLLLGSAPRIVRDHRRWPKGKFINPREWNRYREYAGLAPFHYLHPHDQALWRSKRNVRLPHKPEFSVRFGKLAFKTWRSDGTRMGAFWDERTQTLRITRLPSKKSVWDVAADNLAELGRDVKEFFEDAWDVIRDDFVEIVNQVRKTGCALVGNDIVVSLAATGAGIVASPAAAATVVSGATAGRTACAVVEVSEAVYAILKLLSREYPKPPPLEEPEGQTRTLPPHIARAVSYAKARLLLPVPEIPPSKPYPTGAFQAYNPKTKLYHVAIPTAALSGATSYVVETSTTRVVGVPEVSYREFVRRTEPSSARWPWIVGGIGVLVVALSVYGIRRRLTKSDR